MPASRWHGGRGQLIAVWVLVLALVKELWALEEAPLGIGTYSLVIRSLYPPCRCLFILCNRVVSVDRVAAKVGWCHNVKQTLTCEMYVGRASNCTTTLEFSNFSDIMSWSRNTGSWSPWQSWIFGHRAAWRWRFTSRIKWKRCRSVSIRLWQNWRST